MMHTPPPTFRLDGKTAIVTGASSGIGARFARVLHEAGANVVASARRLERLDALADELERVVAVPCDVADDSQCEHLIAETVARFGRIDVLVNNAGATATIPAEEEPVETFRRVVDVNLTATFLLSQLAARHMLAEPTGGVIVNVASILGLVGAGQIPQASYTASKAGVVNLTRELAAQWGRRGVRVNAIAPGWFPTEMTETMFTDDRSHQWIKRRTPMGRAGETHELDGALLFLASDASTYVTGQVIAVDGGWVSI
jgi:NAD(P)-dependent dehydrogenase (short-subunit alcohol dehydrogenase family)